MNHSIKTNNFIFLLGALAVGFTSCKKESSITSAATENSTASSTITVAASNLKSTDSTSDSLYILQPCPRDAVRDSIAAADLPATVTNYLTTNYAGYTFNKAYSIKDGTGNVIGYVAIIYFNDKPVGILFDGTGTFTRVLEQREKSDLNGQGWHHGGRFEGRGGNVKDSVSLAALPAAVSGYYASNYPGDTLLKAFTNRDSSYIVLSKNDGLFASVFDATGTFVKRVALPSKPAIYQVKDQANLPAVILSYLDTSYPNYILNKAFALSLNGAVKAYLVLIDANDTKYALEFDGAGNFVRVNILF